MSTLSREVARWIQTHPGPIYALNEADLWDQVVAQFKLARRWKTELDLQAFMLYMRNCGYAPECRPNHAKDRTSDHFHILALPEPHRGF